MRWSTHWHIWAFGTSTCRSRPGKCGGFLRKRAWPRRFSCLDERHRSGPQATSLKAGIATTMAIKIEKTFQVNEPIDQVWNFLRDPSKVASCVPGAEITEAVDE